MNYIKPLKRDVQFIRDKDGFILGIIVSDAFVMEDGKIKCHIYYQNGDTELCRSILEDGTKTTMFKNER